jgi:hypothetical protein
MEASAKIMRWGAARCSLTFCSHGDVGNVVRIGMRMANSADQAACCAHLLRKPSSFNARPGNTAGQNHRRTAKVPRRDQQVRHFGGEKMRCCTISPIFGLDLLSAWSSIGAACPASAAAARHPSLLPPLYADPHRVQRICMLLSQKARISFGT